MEKICCTRLGRGTSGADAATSLMVLQALGGEEDGEDSDDGHLEGMQRVSGEGGAAGDYFCGDELMRLQRDYDDSFRTEGKQGPSAKGNNVFGKVFGAQHSKVIFFLCVSLCLPL